MGRTKPRPLVELLILIGISLAAPTKLSAARGDPPANSTPRAVANRGTIPAGEFPPRIPDRGRRSAR